MVEKNTIFDYFGNSFFLANFNSLQNNKKKFQSKQKYINKDGQCGQYFTKDWVFYKCNL